MVNMNLTDCINPVATDQNNGKTAQSANQQ